MDDALPSVAGGVEVPGALTNTTPVVTTGAATATGAMATAARPHPSSPAETMRVALERLAEAAPLSARPGARPMTY